MTYSARESSEYSGQPIELYTFQKDSNIWRYTSSDEDKSAFGHDYLAYPISRNNIEQTLEMSRSGMVISMSKNVPFCLQFRGSPPTSVINLTVHRYHEGLAEYIVIWMGRVTTTKFTEREAQVSCEAVFTSLKRPVLRLRYQTTCPHVLYGNSCRVNRSAFAVPSVLINNAATVLYASAFALYPNQYFTGGYIDWDTGYDVQRRFIVDHVTDHITISLPFSGIQGGDNMVAYPGCDHLLTTCNSKFGNEPNYGGQPFYPGKNPFTGTTIF